MKRNPSLPHPLRQALAHQRKLFDGLRGPRPRFVPIDFTVPEDGFPPHDYGLEILWRVLEETGPVAFETLHRGRAEAESDLIRGKARPLIFGCGAAAAGAGAVPVPIVGDRRSRQRDRDDAAGACNPLPSGMDARDLRPVQQCSRRRCLRLVYAEIRPP